MNNIINEEAKGQLEAHRLMHPKETKHKRMVKDKAKWKMQMQKDTGAEHDARMLADGTWSRMSEDQFARRMNDLSDPSFLEEVMLLQKPVKKKVIKKAIKKAVKKAIKKTKKKASKKKAKKKTKKHTKNALLRGVLHRVKKHLKRAHRA